MARPSIVLGLVFYTCKIKFSRAHRDSTSCPVCVVKKPPLEVLLGYVKLGAFSCILLRLIIAELSSFIRVALFKRLLSPTAMCFGSAVVYKIELTIDIPIHWLLFAVVGQASLRAGCAPQATGNNSSDAYEAFGEIS